MGNVSIVFDHIHLISEAPESAAAWYVEKLGGKLVGNNEVQGAPQFYVAFEGATLIIRGQRTGEQAVGKKGSQWGTDHFGFHVQGDFDAFCNDLKQRGVTFTMDPVDFSPTVRIAFFEAPDGVHVELLQRKA